MDKKIYQRLVVRLIFISYIMSDIVFVVNIVSQFMHHPKEAHLQVALRFVQYLKRTPEKEILFKRRKMKQECES